MILHEFPDINWLKRQIKLNFQNQRSWDNSKLPHKGWPSVILNTRVNAIERGEIEGPFSVFINLKGASKLKVGKREIELNDSSYAFTNSGQLYDLCIKSKEETTETFNLHFGTRFTEKAVYYLQNNDQNLLDNPFGEENTSELPFRSFFKSKKTNAIISKLKRVYEMEVEQELKEELLFETFTHFYTQANKECIRSGFLESSKQATRLELMRRLYIAIDCIHSNYGQPLKLEKLAQLCCLSKFHFLRLFKQAFKLSPYQYIKQIRLDKAWQLLKENKYTVYQIALAVGFENSSSLTRAFSNTFGKAPSHLYFSN
jgi:AraC family transcriptional regulator